MCCDTQNYMFYSGWYYCLPRKESRAPSLFRRTPILSLATQSDRSSQWPAQLFSLMQMSSGLILNSSQKSSTMSTILLALKDVSRLPPPKVHRKWPVSRPGAVLSASNATLVVSSSLPPMSWIRYKDRG